MNRKEIFKSSNIYIFLAILLICILGYFLIGSYIKNNNNKNLYIKNIKEESSLINNNLSNYISSYIYSTFDSLKKVKSSIEFSSSKEVASIQKFLLEEENNLNLPPSNIYFCDFRNNTTVYSKENTKENTINPLIRKIDINENRDYLLPSYNQNSLNRDFITLATPIVNDKIKGVLCSNISIDNFNLIYQYSNINLGLDTYLLDDSLRVISSLNKENIGKSFNDIFVTNYLSFDNPHRSEILSLLKFEEKAQGNYTFDDFYSTNSPMVITYESIANNSLKIVTLNNSNFFKLSRINYFDTLLYSKIIKILLVFAAIILLLVIRTIYKNKNLKKALLYDVFTGLPNRYAMEKKVKSLDPLYNSFFIFLSIKNVNTIYETMRYEDSDSIIKIFAEELKKIVLEANYTLGRIERYKFCILVENSDPIDVLTFCDKIQKTFSKKQIIFSSYTIDIETSIGISHINNNKNASVSFSLAEMALNKANENKNSKIVYLSPDDLNKSIEEIYRFNKISASIKYAIRENKLLLYLQPIMNVREQTISHYEALIRLINEDGAFIPPNEFIPIAEKSGLIREIDKWVFKRAINVMKENPHTKIFINLSGTTLNDTSTLKYFEDELLQLRLDRVPINLGIEITETSIIKNIDSLNQWMEVFNSLGCTFALDDFGVGYTSISYLGKLPVEFIKIDGSFIKKLTTDKNQESIVRAIKMVCETFNKKTVGEYVENEDIFNKLLDLNIDYAQGYHVGKPFPSLDIDKRFKTCKNR